MKKLQTFETILNRLAPRYGVFPVFSDFLTLCVCAFSLGRMESLYLETIRKYEKPDAYLFSEALAALVIEMTGIHGNGFVDVLGEYFQNNISHGFNGQYFTPQPICDMMARMVNPSVTGERIADPACGSGRMLFASAKVNRFAIFYGADIDVNCAKMAVINLCLNSLYGEIAWMDSLTNRFYCAWEIFPTIKGLPCIKQIPKELSYIYLQLPWAEAKPAPQKQQLIFEF